MALATALLININSSTDKTDGGTYTTTNATTAANDLLIAMVGLSRTSAQPSVPYSVTFGALTLSRVTAADFYWMTTGTDRRSCWLYAAIDPVGGLHSIQVTVQNDTSACVASTWTCQGYLDTGTAANNILQPTTGSDVTGTATSAVITLAAASNSNNRPCVAIFKDVNQTTTQPTSWTRNSTVGTGTPASHIMTAWRSDTFETAGSSSWVTAANWGGISFELAAANPDLKNPKARKQGLRRAVQRAAEW